MKSKAGGSQQRVTRTSARLITSPTPSYAETDSEDDADSNLGDQWRRRKRSGRSGGSKKVTKKHPCPTPHPNRTRLNSTSTRPSEPEPQRVTRPTPSVRGRVPIPTTEQPSRSCHNIESDPPMLTPEPVRKQLSVRETRLRKGQAGRKDNTGELTPVDTDGNNVMDSSRPSVEIPGPSSAFVNGTLPGRSASDLPVENYLDSTTPSQDTVRPIRPNPRHAIGSYNMELENPGPSPIPVHITQNNIQPQHNNSWLGFEGVNVQPQAQHYRYDPNCPECQFSLIMNYNYCLMHAQAPQGRNYVHDLQGNALQNFSGNLPRTTLEIVPTPEITPGMTPRNDSDELPILGIPLRRIQPDNYQPTPPAVNIPGDQVILPQNQPNDLPQDPPAPQGTIPRSTVLDLQANAMQNSSGVLPRSPLPLPEVPAVSSFGSQQANLQGSSNPPQIIPGINEANMVYASGYPVEGRVSITPGIVPRNQSDDLPVLSVHLRRIQPDNFLLTAPAANTQGDQGLLPQNALANLPRNEPANLSKTPQAYLPQNPPANFPQNPPANLVQNPPTILAQNPPTNLTQNPPVNFSQNPPANLPRNRPAYFQQDLSANLPQNPPVNLPQNPSADFLQNPPSNIQQNTSTNFPQNQPANLPQNPPARLPEIPPANLPNAPTANFQQNPRTNLPQIPRTNLPQMPRTNLPQMPRTNLPQIPRTNLPQIPPANFPQNPPVNLRQNALTLQQSPTVNLPQIPPVILSQNPPANLREIPQANLTQNPSTNSPQIPLTNFPQNPPVNLPQNPVANLSDPHTGNGTNGGPTSNVDGIPALERPGSEVLETYWPMFRCIRQLGSHMQKQPTVYEQGIYHLKKVLDIVGIHHNQLWLPEPPPAPAPATASTSGTSASANGAANDQLNQGG